MPTLIRANVLVNALLPAIAAAEHNAPAVSLHLALEDHALAALAPRLGRPADAAAIAAFVAGPLLSTYSKRPGAAFDNAARLARRAVLVQELAADIAEARIWVERTTPDLAALEERIAATAL